MHELLELVQIERLVKRYPHPNCRADSASAWRWRARSPSSRIVLLLDEPFGALDAKVRKELRRWLRRLNEEMSMTSIFVTHDQEEAMEIADRVVVMSHGRIEQIGTPREIYENPANPFVCEFLGSANRIPCAEENRRLASPVINLDGISAKPGFSGGGHIYVRPHDIALEQDGEGPGTVKFMSIVGPVARVDIEITSEPGTIEVEVPTNRLIKQAIEVGSRVRLTGLKGHMYE